MAATGLRVTAQAPHGDRDVKRASVDFDLDALAVPDSVARRGRNSATVTGTGQGDLGQVAQSMRDRDGYPAHDDTRAGTSAGGAELRWYCHQIPANGLIAAMPGQYIPLFFQAGAGMSIALGIPVKLAFVSGCSPPRSRLLAADRAARVRPRRVGTWPVSCQEPSRSPAAD